MCPRETTALQLDILNKRKQHIDENNVKKISIEEDKRQKVHILQKSSNDELNLPLTHTKKDLFGIVGIK